MKLNLNLNLNLSSFLVLALLSGGMLSSCSEENARYDLVDNGVVVNIDHNGARKIRLLAVSDDIIRVSATPGEFASTESLITIPVDGKPNVRVEESEGAVVLKTTTLQARVDNKTGEVTFLDKSGATILREKQGGGKEFKPSSEVPGRYQIRQIFESPADEAFYGLGGHQNGQMNYKNDDVDLVQHNIVDIVPFVYSSRNYGILWDNYSISKFGDPREYLPLSGLQLFNKEGQEGGLTATYFVREKVVKTATENRIEYEYLETPQVDQFPKDIANEGKITWEGTFASEVEGDHKFLFYSSGYLKVWIDGKLILDNWRQNWNPWTNKFRVPLRKGEKKPIRIEWIPQGGYLAVKHLDPISAEEQSRLSLQSDVASQIDYYFIKGENADQVISGYRTVTGKAPLVPKWAMGFWQSRERYRNQAELIDVVKEYRKRRIPLDNIVLDWQYWKDPEWGSHEFDETRFPDPRGMIDQLHKELHTNLMISVWPKFNVGTEHYNELDANGFLFKRNVEKKRKDWVGVGYESTFYDPFNPEAGKMFWSQLDEHLNSIGVDAWWLDATEPDMHSNLSLEERKLNMSPTALGPGAEYFNAYSLMNAKGVYEGQRRSSPDKRVFILTRSAYAGQQRYGAVTWSGDIVSRWSDFKDQIATGINFSLSGIPYWTMDIGGFAVERRYENPNEKDLKEWRELNTRWFQFGAFCPIFRSHGQYPFREIFNIAPAEHPAYKSMVYYTNLRYRLMPYLYSLAGSSYHDDYTIMRGLIMDFADDPRVQNIADQYMLGPSIMVNPVYQYGATSRSVYLPASSAWFDFYTGEFFKGGQTLDAKAPYERIPLYVKAGSILPMGPELQYTDEKPADPVTLYVFTGSDATFTLYEDEGTNYNYENGMFSKIRMDYEDETKVLTINQREGNYKGMPEERTFRIVWVKTDHPAGGSLESLPSQEIRYRGETIAINLK
jgi:alpha-D-xyloside xylohydrolase